MSYLDGLKRAIDDEEFAKRSNPSTPVSDPKILSTTISKACVEP
jgi:hypothetical protein